jgi:hypothetical protein
MGEERPQHPYPCQNLGCPNGYQSIFYKAPPEWYARKGLSTPKNCPDCRAWIDAQTDSLYHCRDCGWQIRRSAKAKISHHKREGPYEPPTQCTQCKEGTAPTPPRNLRRPRFPTLIKKRDPEPLTVVPYDQLLDYRKVHYGKHIPGHPFSEVGQPRGDGGFVSATSLVEPGAMGIELYAQASGIANRAEGTYQYISGTNVIKATIVNGTHVEVTIFRPLPDGRYEFVTSYDEVSIGEARRNVRSQDWR